MTAVFNILFAIVLTIFFHSYCRGKKQMQTRDEIKDKHPEDLQYMGKGKTIFFSVDFLPIIFIIVVSGASVSERLESLT